MGAADAFDTASFGLHQISDHDKQDDCHNCKDDEIGHRHSSVLNKDYFRTLLPFLIRATTTTAKHATAIRPPRKPAPKEPVVTRVPI